MDASFIPVEVVPSRTPFALDQLRRSYKTALSATAAIAAAPAVGTVDESFPNMFLMPVSTPETAESATRIDLVYMGTFGEDLPAQKHDSESAVQSASSSYGSSGGLAQPLTVQFYAPSNVLTYFSSGAPGTTEADDPTGDPVIITVSTASGNFAPGTTMASIATNYFSTQIVQTLSCTEIVPAQFWQNVSRKTKVFIPYLTTVPAGTAFLGISNPGTGYAVGNVLTVTSGSESATLSVTSLGVSQSIFNFNVTANTFTTAHPTGIPATGGSGSGASFYVAIV